MSESRSPHIMVFAASKVFVEAGVETGSEAYSKVSSVNIDHSNFPKSWAEKTL